MLLWFCFCTSTHCKGRLFPNSVTQQSQWLRHYNSDQLEEVSKISDSKLLNNKLYNLEFVKPQKYHLFLFCRLLANINTKSYLLLAKPSFNINCQFNTYSHGIILYLPQIERPRDWKPLTSCLTPPVVMRYWLVCFQQECWACSRAWSFLTCWSYIIQVK